MLIDAPVTANRVSRWMVKNFPGRLTAAAADTDNDGEPQRVTATSQENLVEPDGIEPTTSSLQS